MATLGIVPREVTPPSSGPITGLMIRSLDDALKLGQVFAASKLFADVTDANRAVVKILAGMEMGLGPFAAMRSLHLIHGSAVPAAGVVAALVRQHPDYDFDIVEHDEQHCLLRFYRRGKPVGDSGFTMEDAKAAGLITANSNWTKYPRNMLFSRAVTNGARWYCPDLMFDLGGVSETDLDAATGYETKVSEMSAPRVMQGGWDAPADGDYWRRMFFGTIRDTELDGDDARHEWLLEQVGVASLRAYLDRATNADMRKLVEEAAYLTSRTVPTEVPTDEELTAGWERLGESPQPALAEKRAEMDAGWFPDEESEVRVETSVPSDAVPAPTANPSSTQVRPEFDSSSRRTDWDDVDAFVSGFRNRVRERNQAGPVANATGLQVFDVMRAAMRDDVKGTQTVVAELAGRQTRIKDLTAGEANELLETANREGAAAWKAWCEAIVARRLAAEQADR